MGREENNRKVYVADDIVMSAVKENNLTMKEHYEYFKEMCFKWIDLMGLKDWQISFYHTDLSTANGGLAGFKIDVPARIVNIYLAKDWGTDKPTTRNLERSAFHEIFHVLLAKMVHMALQRVIIPSDLEEEEHKIIRVFDNIIFGHEEMIDTEEDKDDVESTKTN